LSNTFLEHGADVIVGVPQLTLEVSAGVPSDVGAAIRRPGFDTVVRGQAALGALIVGVSHIQTRPYQDEHFARGLAVFTGVDVRYMSNGVQLRGEWISGRPFDGTSTTGGYADLIVHRPGMGPLTAVVRAERLAYDAQPPFDLYCTRFTGGARVRVLGRLTAVVDVIHQSAALAERRPVSVDVGFTYSVRSK
jgi:hypothetical protein